MKKEERQIAPCGRSRGEGEKVIRDESRCETDHGRPLSQKAGATVFLKQNSCRLHYMNGKTLHTSLSDIAELSLFLYVVVMNYSFYPAKVHFSQQFVNSRFLLHCHSRIPKRKDCCISLNQLVVHMCLLAI